MRIKDLMESPIGDYITVGDFSKNSSFRKERDRKLITNDKTIEHVKKKFSNCPYDFDFIFVNNPSANKHTEVGEVSLDWIQSNLGDEVYHILEKRRDTDSIKIVFTNNKGTQGVPMTAWIMAHRISHALHRKNGRRDDHSPHNEAERHFISMLGDISDTAYNKPFTPREAINNRNIQLLIKHLSHAICTFKSARDKNLRDYFETYNELFAQYVTTGNVKFNPLPKQVRAGSRLIAEAIDDDSFSDASDMLETLANDMEFMYDDVLSYAIGRIYVM